MTRKLVLAGVSATALLLLSACGGGGDDSPPETAAAPEPATPAAPATPPADTAAATPPADATVPPADTAAATPPAGAAPAGGAVVLAGLTGDPTAGQKVFAQCRTCHVVEAGVNKVGPSLAGIIGRPAGTIPGFRYSPANKNSGIVWTNEVMFAYLENPRKYIPGTYMSFVGLKQPQQRADVIAYLNTAS